MTAARSLKALFFLVCGALAYAVISVCRVATRSFSPETRSGRMPAVTFRFARYLRLPAAWWASSSHMGTAGAGSPLCRKKLHKLESSGRTTPSRHARRLEQFHACSHLLVGRHRSCHPLPAVFRSSTGALIVLAAVHGCCLIPGAVPA